MWACFSNIVFSLASPIATWSPGQLLFAAVWPLVVFWFIKTVIIEKMWQSSVSPAEEFKLEIRKEKQAFRDQSDPNSDNVRGKIYGVPLRPPQVLIALYREILDLDLEVLRERLQQDKYTATTVLCAYVWRAMKIDDQLTCITQVIKEAFENADRLDEEYYQKNKQKGPLHGLPFSVKSNFNIAGYPASVGLKKLLTPPKETTCPMVTHLQNLGAVPFCLTNVPQGLLSYITSNPLYGTTKNPWDFDRTPGGSSGGEGALVSAGGAAFGIGSDLAGSLRIPAAFCGLVTLKPTQDRLVTTGTHGGLPGRGRLGMSFGFYTRYVDDQEYLLRQIVGNPEYRKLCRMSTPSPLAPIPSEMDQERKPRIGYFTYDGFHPVVPSQERAVTEMKTKFEEMGYDVVEFKISDIVMLNDKGNQFEAKDYADMLFRNVMPDNGAYMANQIYGGETRDTYMKTFIRGNCVKNNSCGACCFSCIRPLFNAFAGEQVRTLVNAGNSNLAACRQNQENTDIFKERWLEYWQKLGIDALICPSFCTPAQYFSYPTYLSTGTFLTGLFNMLDVPAGIVPVGDVSEADITNLKENYEVTNRVLKWTKKTSLGTIGLPTAVQVVTLPYEEEMCLRVMRIVEAASRGNVKRLKWKGDDVKATTAGTGSTKSSKYFDRVPLVIPPRRV